MVKLLRQIDSSIDQFINSSTKNGKVILKSKLHAIDMTKECADKEIVKPLLKQMFGFTQNDCRKIKKLSMRLHDVCEIAKEKKVRVLFDAEQTYY